MQNELLKTAVKQFGTPLYCYDSDAITAKIAHLQSLMPKNLHLFYSLKANPSLAICHLLQKLGAHCEVCSLAELNTAIAAGFKSQQIIYVGPLKTAEELQACIEIDIYAVVCESIAEVFQLAELSQQANKITKIFLRINPPFSLQNAPLKMGGKATQFGMEMSDIDAHIQKILAINALKVIGIHIYNGTRILDANAIITNTKNIIQLARELMQKWKHVFKCIDIGGGLGVPYFTNETKLDIEVVFNALRPMLLAFNKDYPYVQFILESGRYLIAEAGYLIATIHLIKASRGEHFLITDAGMNCHMSATGLGSFIRRNFPISVIRQNTPLSAHTHLYNITGPLCTPGDLLASQISLPKAQVGDLIVIQHAGAYGLTASLGRFLSHGYPAEALLDQGLWHLIRRRETSDDILKLQQLPTMLLPAMVVS